MINAFRYLMQLGPGGFPSYSVQTLAGPKTHWRAPVDASKGPGTFRSQDAFGNYRKENANHIPFVIIWNHQKEATPCRRWDN